MSVNQLELALRPRTSKTGGHEHPREATKAADEGRAGQPPVLAADVVVSMVRAAVYGDAKDDEYDDGDDLKRREPVFWGPRE
jgi:hypothetical protein